jgi:hypothetical protein
MHYTIYEAYILLRIDQKKNRVDKAWRKGIIVGLTVCY